MAAAFSKIMRLYFNLGTRTAGREPHHPQRNDILRFDAELESFQGEGQPWI